MKTILEYILAAEGLNNVRLAAIMDVAPASISHILSGRNKPSYDFIVKLVEAFPQYDARWLITGKGEPQNSEVMGGQGLLDFNIDEVGNSEAANSANTTMVGTLDTAQAAHENSASQATPAPYETIASQKAAPFAAPQTTTTSPGRLIVCFPDHTFEEYVKR